jgi:hypothetical protein
LVIQIFSSGPQWFEYYFLPEGKIIEKHCLWSRPQCLYLQLSIQSVPITTDVVSSNLDQGRCTTLCDKVCQWLATGLWFSPGPPVSSTNKTDCHNITEILLKVALNTTKRCCGRDHMVVGFITTYAISAYHL